MVARLRGALFTYDSYDKRFSPDDTKSMLMADEALRDVCEWLGFDEYQFYADSLEAEREQIFKRAKE